MPREDEEAESVPEQPKDFRLVKAEAWISQEAEEGNEEALVYLRSRGHDCELYTEKLRQRWEADEAFHFQQFGLTNPKHAPVSRANLDALPIIFGNFWASGEDGHSMDASMLRADQWCGMSEFKPWWARIEQYNQGLLFGSRMDSEWLFNMARSDIAIEMPLLKRYLAAFSASPEDDHRPLIADWSAIIFLHRRLSHEPSTAVSQMLNRLLREQDADGSWCTWLHTREPSVQSTAMALHALALAKPLGSEHWADRGREWLWSQQETDGYWNGPDPLYLTVLVLDAINLADGRPELTFTLSGESKTDAVAPSDSDAGTEKSPRSVRSLIAAKACQKWMHANVLNQAQFAKRAGRSPKTIRKFFRTGEMRTSDFDDMAKRLGVTAPELHRGELPLPRTKHQ